MDHLTLPGGEEHFITAPYEAPESDWYDGLDFNTYPQRKGWTEEQLRGGDDTSKDGDHDPNGFQAKGKGSYKAEKDQNVEQFFQTWLFFGLAIEVLKVGGVTVKTDEFLAPPEQFPARIVSTWTLPARLLEWEENLKKRDDLEDVWKVLNKMFERAASVLNRFCPLVRWQDRPPNLEKPRPWPVRDEISTTMIGMAFSLRLAATKICNPRGVDLFSPWPAARSEILAKRLQTKACLADVTTTLKELPIDGHYYLAASPGLEPRELDHHSKCVPEHCLYDYDAKMYVTRHANPEPFSDCHENIKYGGHLGPDDRGKTWPDAISSILNEKDVVPIALWLKGRRELWSVEYHLEDPVLKPDYVAISHVWSEGKGNPRGNALPECQLDRIQRLVEKVTWEGRKEIPSNPNHSDGVGFWMDTLCLPAASGPAKKAAIQTMRRVYSEAKAVLVLDDLLEAVSSDAPPLEIAARLYNSNWLKRLWTHQEGFLPRVVWIQFYDQPVELTTLRSKLDDYVSWMDNMGTHLAFPMNMNIRLVQQYTSLRGLIQLTNETNKWTTYGPLAAAMCDRNTAKLSDETICLSTIIDLPVRDFINISSPVDGDDEGTAKLRMEHFVLTLGKFQSATIFNNYERLDKPGYRWAPKSLLNLRTADIYPSTKDNVTCEFKKVNNHLGLLVQYPGFRISFSQDTPSFASVSRACAIQCNSSVAEINGKWFVVELPPNNAQWTTGQTYAVILSEMPNQKGQRCPAVVAKSTKKALNDVWTVEHQSIADVRVLDEAPPWIDQVEGTLRRKTTQWLIT